MLIPILISAVPSLIKVAENLFSKPQVEGVKTGDAKKQWVMDVLSSLYDKHLSGVIPDLPGVDEKKIILEIFSHVIDFAVKKYLPN